MIRAHPAHPNPAKSKLRDKEVHDDVVSYEAAAVDCVLAVVYYGA